MCTGDNPLTAATIAKEAGVDGFIAECKPEDKIDAIKKEQAEGKICLLYTSHLPESTLVMLVSALAGREHILNAYEEAIRERYRFFSFGDAMFIVNGQE